jgi:hypothetical protein
MEADKPIYGSRPDWSRVNKKMLRHGLLGCYAFPALIRRTAVVSGHDYFIRGWMLEHSDHAFMGAIIPMRNGNLEWARYIPEDDCTLDGDEHHRVTALGKVTS